MEENTKLKVGPGMFVEYSYKLYDENGNKLLFETPDDAPDMMVYGVSQEIVPGLIAALKDLTAGDRFEVVLPPQAAFGEYIEDNVVELEKEIFMRDGKLADEVKVGAELPMMTAEGYRIMGKVLSVDNMVKMDFNHPFAGLTVRYEGEVKVVREATPEELSPVRGCGGGCGGCGGGCGSHDEGSSCQSGGCGEGCCH